MPSTFTPEGLLPVGDHVLSFNEIRSSVLVKGPAERHRDWDSRWRGRLVDNLEFLVRQLWQVGVTEIVAGGSFTMAIDRPDDIDIYFLCDQNEYRSGMLEYRLNLVAPHPFWSWDPCTFRPDARGIPRTRMRRRYQIDVYPDFGQTAHRVGGRAWTFPELFRVTMGRNPRGVVSIVRNDRAERATNTSVVVVGMESVTGGYARPG